MPITLLNLAKAYAQLGKFDEASGCISEATATVERTKERWFEAEVYRMAGEIALQSVRRAKPGITLEQVGVLERRLTTLEQLLAKNW